MVVFLSCTKTKRNYKCAAKDMYVSDLFRKSYAYAQELGARQIYILSAKYGLLEPADIISPYELTLNKLKKVQRKTWAYKVVKQLQSKGQDFSETAIFLCGDKYREYIVQKFKDAKAPLKGVPFGKQLKFYKQNIKRSEETT